MKFELQEWFIKIEHSNAGHYWVAFTGEEDYKIECLLRYINEKEAVAGFSAFALKHNLENISYV